jgi:hypothetical protein
VLTVQYTLAKGTLELGLRRLDQADTLAGETDTTPGNAQDWLQLAGGDIGYLLLTERNIST